MGTNGNGSNLVERLEDAELVRRVQNDDQDAYAALFKKYLCKLQNFVSYHYPRLDHEAIAQETMLQLYKNRMSIREPEHISAWLHKIAINFCRQECRKKFYRINGIEMQKEYVNIDEHVNILEAHLSRPDELHDSKELCEKIFEVIEKLPLEYRGTFALAAIHRMPYDEIAEILGRSLAAVKNDVHRARAEVRNTLKEYLQLN